MMTTHRRRFLTSVAAAGASTVALRNAFAEEAHALKSKLDQILSNKVLKLDSLSNPVIIESIELLKQDRDYMLRIRSKDGVEAITMPNPGKMDVAIPVLFKDVVPVFLGKDARDIESLLWDVYRYDSNYKMQGLIFWVAVAAVEMAVLELLSRSANVSIAELFGGRLRLNVPVYYASSNRGNTPEAEIDHLKKLVGDSGVKAIKWRLGGRMSRNEDSPPKRTETLIPMVRNAFGDSMVLYGDSNSSYDVPESIRIGRMMEQSGYEFFEEPCEFDDLWGTREVTKALAISIAGGEEEYSLHRWRWIIENRAVDIVQPDLHYGGGFIRATLVARMAQAAGLSVVPHMSAGGLGYVEVIQFASFTPNIGPYMEFKGNTKLPVQAVNSSLKCEKGTVQCPEGIGFGISLEPDFVRRAEKISA